MKFAQPLWLIGGVIACALLLWRYRRFDRQQATLLTSFVSPHLAEQLTRSFSPQRRTIKRALFVAATACLFIALARPQAGFRWEETQRKGLEILFAVDTSKSMLAEDVKPNRLTRAKLAVEDLLGNLNGDGVGLVAFAGSSFLQCPVTLDYDAFRDSLAALDTSVIPRGGTDIASAIREAQAAFKTRESSDRILVLMTDGEDLGGEGIAAAQAAAKDGVKIFTVGVGSANGELVPGSAENGGTEFVKDESGQFVKSRLDETALKQIAEVTGGMYQPLGQQSQGLAAIYEQGLKPFTRHELAARQHKVYIEQFRWALLAALVLFVLESLIGTRRRALKTDSQDSVAYATQSRSKLLTTASCAAVVLIGIVMTPVISHASPGSAEKAYLKGDYTKAAQDYANSAQKQPAKPELQFNLGAAAYKSGEFATSEEAFQSALKTESIPVQQSAYYNLGNTQYRSGQKTEQSNPEETIKTWESAVQSYEAALQIKSDDADAKYNRDLVKRKLEQLKQQQQQQKQDQEQQNQSDQNKSDQDKKQDSKQDQNQQAGKGSDEEKNEDQKNQQSQSGQGKPDQEKNQDSKPDQNQQASNGSDQGKQQDQKDQNGSGQEEQKQPGAKEPGQQNASSGENQKPQDKQSQQQASGNSQPEPKKPSKGTPEANAQPDSRQDNEQADASERREPGQMTKEEAKNLLDSLKGEERRVNAGQMARGAAPQDDNKPQRDW